MARLLIILMLWACGTEDKAAEKGSSAAAAATPQIVYLPCKASDKPVERASGKVYIGQPLKEMLAALGTPVSSDRGVLGTMMIVSYSGELRVCESTVTPCYITIDPETGLVSNYTGVSGEVIDLEKSMEFIIKNPPPKYYEEPYSEEPYSEEPYFSED